MAEGQDNFELRGNKRKLIHKTLRQYKWEMSNAKTKKKKQKFTNNIRKRID